MSIPITQSAVTTPSNASHLAIINGQFDTFVESRSSLNFAPLSRKTSSAEKNEIIKIIGINSEAKPMADIESDVGMSFCGEKKTVIITITAKNAAARLASMRKGTERTVVRNSNFVRVINAATSAAKPDFCETPA